MRDAINLLFERDLKLLELDSKEEAIAHLRSVRFSNNLEPEFRCFGVRFLTLGCELTGVRWPSEPCGR